MGAFNCGAFVAGIVRVRTSSALLCLPFLRAIIYFLIFFSKGVLENAGFPAVVTAHFVPVEGQHRPRTTILIKFAEEVNQFYLIFLLKVYTY